MAAAFQAPFLLYSNNIECSFRRARYERRIRYLLCEGGKSLDINDQVADEGVSGAKRFLKYLNMLRDEFSLEIVTRPMIYIESSTWIRAELSGMFRSITPVGSYVEEGQIIAWITDPFGVVETPVIAPNSGYIINENQASIVFQGGAIFNISTQLKDN